VTRILVCDGEQRAALAVVRSLGRAGHQVDVCSHSPRAIAAVSRYVKRSAIVPDPMNDPGGFVTTLRQLVKSWESEVVLPITDQSSTALLPVRDQLGGAVVPGPDAAAFGRVSDKQVVLEEAARLGIAIPRQFVITDAASALRPPSGAIPFPVVIKPSKSLQKGGRWQARYAADSGELNTVIAEAPADAFPLLVQQRIVGWGSGIFLLVWGGRTIAVFAHRRLRELPPSGGASVFSESVVADPALVDRARALLDRFAWKGIAMIEFKVDAATGTPYLMEVNGRFWGSLQLAIDAGVNFPTLLVAAATGQTMPQTPPAYRTGVRLRWVLGDMLHVLLRLRYDDAELHLSRGARGRWAVLWDSILWHPGVRYDVWRWRDPRPFFRGTLNFFRELLGRRSARPESAR
jgi:predicted ATP-grasp superfamily ATP-dependent carboligase